MAHATDGFTEHAQGHTKRSMLKFQAIMQLNDTALELTVLLEPFYLTFFGLNLSRHQSRQVLFFGNQT